MKATIGNIITVVVFVAAFVSGYAVLRADTERHGEELKALTEDVVTLEADAKVDQVEDKNMTAQMDKVQDKLDRITDLLMNR